MDYRAKIGFVTVDDKVKYVDVKPLYEYDRFNRKGKLKTMRYVFTASNGKETYPLYVVHRGSANEDISQSVDVKHNLYILVKDWAVPFGITEWTLRKKAAQRAAAYALYGCEDGYRKKFREIHNQYSGEEADRLVRELRAKEVELEAQFLYDNQCIADYITERLDWHIKDYFAYKDGVEHHMLNFVGAIFADDLENCIDMYDALEQKRIREIEEEKRKAAEELRQRTEAAEKKKLAELNKAERAFLNGGTVSKGSLLCDLAAKHGVKIPPQTRWWIMNFFESCEIRGQTASICFCKSGRRTISTKIYSVIGELRTAVENANRDGGNNGKRCEKSS